MNIELARTFLEVVSCGSLARAADTLHVTHSTVTMRIKALEDLLRRTVLIRNKSGVTMTAEGVRFYRFAQILVRTWQMTRRQMSLTSGFDSMLSIGADETLWDDVMFDWVCKNRRTHPEIAIRCESGDSETLMHRLFEGWLDVCIVYEPRTTSGYTVEPLFEDPLIIASTVDRSLMDASWDPDYLQIDWDDGVRTQLEARWGEIDETPAISVTRASLGARLVNEFGGSVLVPLRAVRNDSYAGKLFPVKGSPVFDRTAYLVYSQELLKERLPNLPIEEIRRTILAELGLGHSDAGA